MARSKESDDLELDVCEIIMPKVLKPMLDAFVELNSEAKFLCRVRSNGIPIIMWYKDGKTLRRSERITLSYKDKTYQLKIKNVTNSDYGVYSFLCADGISQLRSSAGLYIKPEKNHGVMYRAPCDFETINVDRHIVNNLIEKGERIELEIQLQNEVGNEFLWYKSNDRVIPDERINLLHSGKCSTLSILEAKETDSGLYHVMAKTKKGLVSSFASVVVMYKVENRVRLPVIEELLPEEVACNKNENVNVMCKITVDSHTLPPIWKKNGAEIFDNEKFRKEDYGCGYIGLKLINATLQDAAEYSLTVRNGLTNQIDSTSFLLSVDDPAPITWPTPELVKPLDTAIACFGAQFVMNCKFDLKYAKYFYVVWQVGRYRVERSNHRFIVNFKDGDCMLIIKCLEPEMAGLVSCDLRRALPNRKSVYMLSSTANIVIVPPSFFEEEIKLRPSVNRIFHAIQIKPAPNTAGQSPIKASGSKPSRMKKPIRTSTRDELSILSEEDVLPPTDPLEIAFFRPDEDSYSLVKVIKRSADINSDSLRVYDKKDNSRFNDDRFQKVIIEWDPLQMKTWFLIEIMTPNNIYHVVGVSSKPQFEIGDAPIEKIIHFRVTAVLPREDFTESTVSISPPHNDVPNRYSICDLKTMEEFAVKYTRTEDKIGSGAFGTVSLVKEHRGELFAAKTLKIKSRKKRDAASREFEIMRRLKHSKIVELIDAFMSRDSYILVMDYLWGGELFDRIVEEEYIREVDVIPYVKQICEALKYLHGLRIVHLDVKPENIICLNPNSRQIKLIDFGLARTLINDRITKSLYGTKDYAAPEILSYDKLTTSSDMWSVGVITFVLLSGLMPFAGDSWLERSVNITRANFNYNDSAFNDISDMAKNFIDNLLVLNPDIRMDSSIALCHEWIGQGPSNAEKSGHMHLTRQNLKEYLKNHRARWQRAGNVMIAAYRLRNKIAQRSAMDSETPQVT